MTIKLDVQFVLLNAELASHIDNVNNVNVEIDTS